MKKFLKLSVCVLGLILPGIGNNIMANPVLLDAKSAAGGATSWNITTTHANELIIISCGGYGVGGASLSTAAGTVKVNGSNATYETRGLWLSVNFSWQETIWAFVAPAAGTYTCTCTETGVISPFYFNFAASCYEVGAVLGLGNVLIGGNNNNQSVTTIVASITTTQANAWVYGSIDNNDNGGFGTVAFNGQLTLLNKTYIDDGVDGAQADSTYAAAGLKTITSTDIGASNVWMTFALIAVQPAAVLPVQLTNFECSPNSDGIQLNWATATETNSSHFTVERSADGIQFNAIAELAAAGNSESPRNYTYVDDNPLPGQNYYRLTETDLDGKSQTFNITECSSDKAAYNGIYPNPNNGSFTITLAPSTSTQTVIVYDMMGKQILNRQFEPNTDAASYNIEMPNGSTGMYMAKIINGNQPVAVKKVIVY